MIASWLARCGLVLDDGEVWGPAPGNPRGHFEDKGFTKLHQEVIQSKYKASSGWKAPIAEPLSFVGPDIVRAREIAAARNEKYWRWGWKDPRTVFFLEAWKTIIPDLKVLLLWRSQAEVVDSLIRRSRKSHIGVMKIGIREAVRLWITYNRLICTFKAKYAESTILIPIKRILDYDKELHDLLNNWFQLGLLYRPLSDIYDSRLFGRKAPVHIRALCHLSKGADIENQLLALSDK
jgi:hypothetical protein